MTTIIQDLRFALRTFRKAPGFTLVIVLTLALGIGANTAMFTVVNAVLLSEVPYRHPDKLFYLRAMKGTQEWGPVSGPDFHDYQAQARSFEHLAVYNQQGANLTGGSEPLYVSAPKVSEGFFEIFDSRPQLGRLFTAEDYASRAPVVVLSDGLWSSQFGRDPHVVGRSVTIGGLQATVIGVTEPGFQFPGRAQLWSPYLFDGPVAQLRDSHFLWAIGRLKDGTTAADAQNELNTISGRLAQQFPDADGGRTVAMLPFREVSVRFVRPMLLLLSAGVGLVLLIVCANVANLYMSRALSRRQEIATRLALGARVVRLTRQLLTESLLLAAVGGAVGLLLAQWAVAALMSMAPPGQFPRYAQVRVDATVLAFTAGVSLLAGILFGLAPALGAVRSNLFEILKVGGLRAGSNRGAGAYRNALVIAQLALAVMLVAAGALMLRSMQQLLRVQPGFDAESVMTFQLPMPHTTAEQISARLRELDDLQSRFENLRAARSAAYALFLPLDGNNTNSDFQIKGRPYISPSEAPVAEQRWVSPQFFQTLGIRLLRGRDFSLRDTTDGPKLVIINRAMAEHFWPGADPIGEHVGFEGLDRKTEWSEIVGVVDDVHDFGLGSKVRWEVYIPMSQTWPIIWTGSQNPVVSFAVKAAGDATALTPAITAAIQRVDAAQPMNNVRLLRTTMNESLASPRFGATLLGLFAALGLVIALAGIYSVLTWAVAQRTAEFGIRVAIGATRQNILRLVIGEALTLLAVSLVIGVAGALAVGRAMRSVLFATSANDPVLLAGVALLVSVVALGASYLPARRATNVDPMIALRCE